MARTDYLVMAFFTLKRLVKHVSCKYLNHVSCKYLNHTTLVQMKLYVVHVNREFKQQRRQRRRKRHLKVIKITFK